MGSRCSCVRFGLWRGCARGLQLRLWSIRTSWPREPQRSRLSKVGSRFHKAAGEDPLLVQCFWSSHVSVKGAAFALAYCVHRLRCQCPPIWRLLSEAKGALAHSVTLAVCIRKCRATCIVEYATCAVSDPHQCIYKCRTACIAAHFQPHVLCVYVPEILCKTALIQDLFIVHQQSFTYARQGDARPSKASLVLLSGCPQGGQVHPFVHLGTRGFGPIYS